MGGYIIQAFFETKFELEYEIAKFFDSLKDCEKLQNDILSHENELQLLEKNIVNKLLKINKIKDLKLKIENNKQTMENLIYVNLNLYVNLIESIFKYNSSVINKLDNALKLLDEFDIQTIKNKYNIDIKAPNTLYFNEKDEFLKLLKNKLSKINEVDIKALLEEEMSKITLKDVKVDVCYDIKICDTDEISDLKKYFPSIMDRFIYMGDGIKGIYDYSVNIQNYKHETYRNINSIVKKLGVFRIDPKLSNFSIEDILNYITANEEKLNIQKKQYFTTCNKLLFLNKFKLNTDKLSALRVGYSLELVELKSSIDELELENMIVHDFIGKFICNPKKSENFKKTYTNESEYKKICEWYLNYKDNNIKKDEDLIFVLDYFLDKEIKQKVFTM